MTATLWWLIYSYYRLVHSLLVPRCSSKLTSQEIEKKTLTYSFSARPFIMFWLWLCGFLNSNPDRPFSYFICTANFHSCLYSLLGLQNLQSQHREDTSDYSSKQCTKEINFCENHLCINFLCSRSRRLHKFLATCTDNWTNIQRHQTAVEAFPFFCLKSLIHVTATIIYTSNQKGPERLKARDHMSIGCTRAMMGLW